MAVIDLWYLKRKDSEGKRIPSKRHGRGRRWRVEVEGAPTESFDRQEDAKIHEADIVASMNKGEYVDPRDGKITVAEYAEQWQANLVHDKATADRVEGLFRNHVYDMPLGAMSVADVREQHVQRWVKDRSDLLAASTMATFYPYLVTMFGTLVGVAIPRSPCTKSVRLPSADSKAMVVPTGRQVRDMQRCADPRLGPLPLLVAATGLRPGECFGLEREHIDLEARKIYVRQQVKRTKGHGVYIGALKTKTSRRDVEIPASLVEPLQAFLAATEEQEPLKLWDRIDRRTVKHFERSADLIFRAPSGGPLYHGPLQRMWANMQRGAGLAQYGYGMHSLRHYFATVLIHNGKSVKTVQMALGHASPMITLNTYTHEWPEEHTRTSDLIERHLFSA